MALSTRTIMLAAAAALLAAAPAMSSAPKTAITADEGYRPGQDGVDLAAITGPKGSAQGRLPACADPARRGDLRPC